MKHRTQVELVVGIAHGVTHQDPHERGVGGGGTQPEVAGKGTETVEGPATHAGSTLEALEAGGGVGDADHPLGHPTGVEDDVVAARGLAVAGEEDAVLVVGLGDGDGLQADVGVDPVLEGLLGGGPEGEDATDARLRTGEVQGVVVFDPVVEAELAQVTSAQTPVDGEEELGTLTGGVGVGQQFVDVVVGGDAGALLHAGDRPALPLLANGELLEVIPELGELGDETLLDQEVAHRPNVDHHLLPRPLEVGGDAPEGFGKVGGAEEGQDGAGPRRLHEPLQVAFGLQPGLLLQGATLDGGELGVEVQVARALARHGLPLGGAGDAQGEASHLDVVPADGLRVVAAVADLAASHLAAPVAAPLGSDLPKERPIGAGFGTLFGHGNAPRKVGERVGERWAGVRHRAKSPVNAGAAYTIACRISNPDNVGIVQTHPQKCVPSTPVERFAKPRCTRNAPSCANETWANTGKREQIRWAEGWAGVCTGKTLSECARNAPKDDPKGGPSPAAEGMNSVGGRALQIGGAA